MLLEKRSHIVQPLFLSLVVYQCASMEDWAQVFCSSWRCHLASVVDIGWRVQKRKLLRLKILGPCLPTTTENEIMIKSASHFFTLRGAQRWKGVLRCESSSKILLLYHDRHARPSRKPKIESRVTPPRNRFFDTHHHRHMLTHTHTTQTKRRRRHE